MAPGNRTCNPGGIQRASGMMAVTVQGNSCVASSESNRFQLELDEVLKRRKSPRGKLQAKTKTKENRDIFDCGKFYLQNWEDLSIGVNRN